jgi:tricorn protease
VSATQIAFACAGNIWSVERAPAAFARRLTSFAGRVVEPALLAGRQVDRLQRRVCRHTDVYIVPAEGGEPKRDVASGQRRRQGWMPDGKSIIFPSARATWAPSGAALLDRVDRRRPWKH